MAGGTFQFLFHPVVPPQPTSPISLALGGGAGPGRGGGEWEVSPSIYWIQLMSTLCCPCLWGSHMNPACALHRRSGLFRQSRNRRSTNLNPGSALLLRPECGSGSARGGRKADSGADLDWEREQKRMERKQIRILLLSPPPPPSTR